MCTLTYIPLEEGYLFTHNRDERNNRPTSPKLHSTKIGDTQVVFPKDLEASGTWIAAGNDGRSVCLLNGGQNSYERNPPYRHSRGLVPLAYFEYSSAPLFAEDYNTQGLEPFTLLIRDHFGLWQFSHDLSEDQLIELDPGEKGIWSSTTLYTQEVRRKRERWFEQWLQQKPELTQRSLVDFHLSTGDGDSENDLVMSRWGLLETLSITQIKQGGQSQMWYKDLFQDVQDLSHWS